MAMKEHKKTDQLGQVDQCVEKTSNLIISHRW